MIAHFREYLRGLVIPTALIGCLYIGFSGCTYSTERYPFPSKTIDLEIAFSGHYKELVLMHVGSGESVSLEVSELVIVAPRFSPDGQKVAYFDLGASQLPMSSTEVTLHILSLAGLETGEVDIYSIPLPQFDIDHRFVVDEIVSPVWEPEGNSVLIGHAAGIDRITVSGVKSRLVEDRVKAITISPSGETIAYSVGNNIMVLDRSHGRPVPILDAEFVPKFGNKAVRDLAYSPNGDRLAFSMGGSLFVLDIETGSVREVCDSTWRIYWVDWGAKGKRIVYLTGRELDRSPHSIDPWRGIEPKYYVVSVSLDGGRQNVLFSETQMDVRRAVPQLSPDKRYVSITGGGAQWREVFVVATDGSAVYQLTTSGLNSYAAWRPRPDSE